MVVVLVVVEEACVTLLEEEEEAGLVAETEDLEGEALDGIPPVKPSESSS